MRSHTVTHPMTLSQLLTEGAYLVTNNRILNGPLSRSLHLFARAADSAHSLHSALLCYARSAQLLQARARSPTLLTPLWDLKIHKHIFTPLT